MKVISTALLFALVLVCLRAAEQEPVPNLTPFTTLDLSKLTRLSQSVPTPDGKYAVYVLRDWDSATGKVTNHIEYIDIASKAKGVLTPKENGKDSNPAFSANFPNTLFFLSSRSGSNQIWTLTLPENPGPTPPTATQLTDYPVDITGFKIAKNTIAFSTEVYSSCGDDLTCTKEKDAEVSKRGKNTYQTYDKLLMRHWDIWKSDKVSHIYAQKITGNANASPVLNGKPLDLMLRMESNSPVAPFGGNEMFSISPDGTEVAYTAADRTRDEAWNTGWKTYISPVGDASVAGTYITSKIQARTTQPQYTPDGKSIAFLAMDRVGLESDKLHIEIYNRATKEISNISGDFQYSTIDYTFSAHDPNIIYLTATKDGVNRIFVHSVTISYSGKLKFLDDNTYRTETADRADDIYSSSVPKNIPGTDHYIVERNCYYAPTDIWIWDAGASQFNQLTDVNPDLNRQFEFVQPTSFEFTSEINDKVQGWLFKPINFVATKKYPLAFLIHGGPESSWTSGFSYGWNPQLYTNHGYAVVMINPHGSVGKGQKFTDAVINDWGGLPYRDLMKGLDEVLAKNNWIDGNRACACGGSYGGYMINWIQGNTDRFKCLVNHDGVFSLINMAYATDELWFTLAENCPLDKTGCKPWDPTYRNNYFKFSPETKVHNWKTPELVIHGSNDFRIPMSEAVSTFSALQVKGVPSRFLHFTEENHWVLKTENNIKWYDEVLGWLDKYTNNKFEGKK